MKRTLLLNNRFAALTLTALCLSSAARAGTIVLDNEVAIYAYAPPSGTAVILSSSATIAVTGMAVSYKDTSVSAPYVILAADYGAGTGAGNGVIYAYTQAGAQSIFNSSITNPFGIAVDPSGNVYVGANGGMDLEELSPTGVLDPSQPIASGLSIQSLVVNSAGDVFSAQNTTVTELVGGTTTYTGLTGGDNYGMAFDYNGDLFVTYDSLSGGGGIDEINAAGNLSLVYSSTAILPTGVAYDFENGNLYMSYTNSFSGPLGGGIDSFSIGAGGTFTGLTPTSFATLSAGSPDAILYVAPEPGSLLLSICGLISIGLFHFRRAGRPARAENDRA